MNRYVAVLLAALPGWWGLVYAQGESSGDLSPIVVTATRVAESSFDVSASINVVDSAAIHDGQLQENISESLMTVPGVSAENRQNYAQDLAAVGARLRRAIELRRARRAPVFGRHSGNDAGRAGPVLAVRSGFRRPHGSAARTVLGALRQLLGRRDLDLHRGGACRATSSTAPRSTARSTPSAMR